MAEVNSFFINPKTKKGGTELKDQIFDCPFFIVSQIFTHNAFWTHCFSTLFLLCRLHLSRNCGHLQLFPHSSANPIMVDYAPRSKRNTAWFSNCQPWWYVWL